MSDNETIGWELCVRRARKGKRIQWTGDNTDKILDCLESNGFRGELFRDYIQIYKDNSYCNTLRRIDWILKQGNGEIKFMNDETMQSKYEPFKD